MRGNLAGLGSAAAVLVAACGLAFPAVSGAAAETVTVTSKADPGNADCNTGGCTLREAITQLDDGDTDDDRIVFNLDPLEVPLIVLAAELPTIDERLTISGSPSLRPIISGNNAVRPISIFNPTPGVDVLFEFLTISGGNVVGRGGGIQNTNGDLTIRDSVITGNQTTSSGDDGGGLYSAGQLVVERSIVSGNSTLGTSSSGGGVYSGGPLTVRRSTVDGNETNGAASSGGGIATIGSVSDAMTIESSTVSGNHCDAGGSGGGIYHGNGGLFVRNSTIASNFVTNGAGASGGGVIFVGPANAALDNSIVANNDAFADGDDIEAVSATYSITFSLIESPEDTPFVDGQPGSTITGVDPQLGPLTDNGGSTATHLPARTSPAIDAGRTVEATDQRAGQRPLDVDFIPNSTAGGADGADMGAVELTAAEAAPPPPPPPVDPDNPSNEFSFGKVKRNKRKGTAKLTVELPGPGELLYAGKAIAMPAAGPTQLKVKAKGKAKRKLKKRGKVKVSVSVGFTPTGGNANEQQTSVKLVRKKRRG